MTTTQAPVDLLLRHGRVITLDRERRILTDGAIAVADGRIVAIGPDREVGESYAPATARTRDLGGAVSELTSARFAMAAAGVVLLGCGIVAVLGRRQILALRVERDGLMRTAEDEVTPIAA